MALLCFLQIMNIVLIFLSCDVGVLLREWSTERLPDRHKSLHRSKQSALYPPRISWVLLFDADASAIAFIPFSHLQKRDSLAQVGQWTYAPDKLFQSNLLHKSIFLCLEMFNLKIIMENLY